jgi:hypothetical protein
MLDLHGQRESVSVGGATHRRSASSNEMTPPNRFSFVVGILASEASTWLGACGAFLGGPLWPPRRPCWRGGWEARIDMAAAG